MSLTIESLKKTAAVLVGRGYSPTLAQHIAELLGDVIEEQEGKWIVRDETGKEIDRIDPI